MSATSDQATGKVKEAVGVLTGDDDLKREGKADQAAGDVKQFVQGVADKVDEAVDAVKDSVHRD